MQDGLESKCGVRHGPLAKRSELVLRPNIALTLILFDVTQGNYFQYICMCVYIINKLEC